MSGCVAGGYYRSHWRPHRLPVRAGVFLALSRISPRVRIRISVTIVLGLATRGYSWIWPFFTYAREPRYIANSNSDFHQMCRVCAVGHKGELVRFQGQLQVKITARPRMVK